MRSTAVIVTCADQQYFELAKSCIHSISANRNRLDFALAFFDVGCTPEQLVWLKPYADFVCRPESHFELLSSVPPHLLGLLARPFLRDYFPGYETYVWIDADAWILKWQAIELFVQGANWKTGMALVPEVDRCSLRQYGGLPDYWHQAYKWYQQHFGKEVAHELCSYPMLNAGVFAIHQSAPHWDAWTNSIRTALRSHCSSMTDQIALNFAIYKLGLLRQTELLPAWCNWTCHNGFPMWNDVNQELVEPQLPRTPVGVLHLTTRDKRFVRTLPCVSNEFKEVCLLFPPKTVNESTP